MSLGQINPMPVDELVARQRRVRRNVYWLAALALSFYAGFIIMAVSGARV